MDLQGIELGIDGLSGGDEIGVGASAAVYRATQIDLDREVAVKVLTVSDPDFVRRFEREARVLGKLSRNPGVVTIYDTGVTTAGRPYLILELCDSSLLEQLQQDGPLDPLEACRIIGEVSDAVAAAHELGVVHRDLKPANVLRTTSGRYLVTDFGISVVSGATAGQTNSVGFTAGYVAPETVSGGAAGPLADVYALGASLFQLVTGETAFTDPTGNSNLMALVNRITTEPVPDLRSRGIPADVCGVIEWAMIKDPSVRPTAAQLREVLREVAAGRPIPARFRQRIDSSRMVARSPISIEGLSAPSVTGEFEAVAGQPGPAPASGQPQDDQTMGPGRPPSGALSFGTDSPRPNVASVGSGSDAAGHPVVGPDTPTMFEQVAAQEDQRAKRRLLVGSLALIGVLAAVAAAAIITVSALGGDDGETTVLGGEATPAGPDGAGLAGGLFTPNNDPAGPPEVRSSMSRVAPVRVPDLTGSTRDEAEALLAEAGLTANVVLRAEPTGPFNVVIGQDPGPGSRVPGEFSVSVIVAVEEAPDEVEVPEVDGSTPASARTSLLAAGLVVVEQVREIYHDTVPVGAVAGTTPPAGSPINIGAEVTIFVSLGPPIMPEVEGLTQAAATAALQALSLTSRVVTEPNPDVAEGLVIRAGVAPGQVVPTGSEVELVVSLGSVSAPCTLPAVRGLTETAARAALSAADCPEPAVVDAVDETVPIGQVVSVAFDDGDPPVPVLAVSSPDCAAVASAQIGLLVATARSAITDAGCRVGAVTEVTRADEPAGTVVTANADGRVVDLVVAVDTTTCTIPDVVGQTVSAAVAQIRAAGCLTVTTGSAADDEIVSRTSPAVGTVIDADQSITVIAAAPEPCDYGSLVGMTRAAAETVVEGAGCTVAVTLVELEAGDPNIGLVVSHDPGPVPADSVVAISVGVAETTNTTPTTDPGGTTVPTTGTVPTTN
jgi:beta-lactam-binding protein with PASTA domain/serine/threonine protein kinase